MPTGKVKWFDSKKGYGLLLMKRVKRYFLAYLSLQKSKLRVLKEDQKLG